MPKKREKSADEYVKAQVRALTAENKQLKKRLKQLERREHSYVDPEPIEESEPFVKPRRCEDCGKGTLEFKNVVGRCWSQCDTCAWRSKVIKI
jgi:hypothetical protein